MQDAETTNEIMDGLRRAKAAFVLGLETIEVRVMDEYGERQVAKATIALKNLRSPFKDFIEFKNEGDWQRWKEILSALQNNEALPPIEVRVGSTGVTISDVEFGTDE